MTASRYRVIAVFNKVTLLVHSFLRFPVNTIVAKINASRSLALHNWFFDDGTLIGCTADLLKALDILSAEGKQSGFEVNFEKCELFWSTDTDLSEISEDINRIATAGVDQVHTSDLLSRRGVF